MQAGNTLGVGGHAAAYHSVAGSSKDARGGLLSGRSQEDGGLIWACAYVQPCPIRRPHLLSITASSQVLPSILGALSCQLSLAGNTAVAYKQRGPQMVASHHAPQPVNASQCTGPGCQQWQQNYLAVRQLWQVSGPCLQLGDILPLVLGWEGHDNGDEALARAALRTDHLRSNHPWH